MKTRTGGRAVDRSIADECDVLLQNSESNTEIAVQDDRLRQWTDYGLTKGKLKTV